MFGQKPAENLWHFDTAGQTEALNRLLYVVENGEPFSLLEGPYGTGKSTVLQQTTQELARGGRRAVCLNVASLDCRAVLWHLCGALSIFTRTDVDSSELMVLIRDELMARVSCRHRTVILLDDADLAQEDIATVLHFLTSVAESSQGHVALIAACEHPMTVALQRRTVLRIQLETLSEQEAVEFAIRYLAHLECPVQQMEDTAWRAIADLSKGLPAQVQRICRIMQAVVSMEPDTIDAALVHQATRELLAIRAA